MGEAQGREIESASLIDSGANQSWGIVQQSSQVGQVLGGDTLTDGIHDHQVGPYSPPDKEEQSVFNTGYSGNLVSLFYKLSTHQGPKLPIGSSQ